MDDNAKVQAAAVNMLNLALTLPDAPADLASVLVSHGFPPATCNYFPLELSCL